MGQSKSDRSDASVMIVDNSTSSRCRGQRRRRGYISQARQWVQVDSQIRPKQAAATAGILQQLKRPMFQTTAATSAPKELTPSVPLLRAVAEEGEVSINYPLVNLTRVNMSLPSANCENNEGGGGYGVCVICMDASSEAVCVPCGHVAGCVSCLKQIKDNKLGCPVCRAKIVQVIKLYRV